MYVCASVCVRVRVSMCRMWHKLGTCCAKTCLCYAIRLTPAPVSPVSPLSPRHTLARSLSPSGTGKISIEYKNTASPAAAG